MKIGILTQPLHTNYGGVLQAYALQKTLEDMGHQVSIISREYAIFQPLPLYERGIRVLKNLARFMLGVPTLGRFGVKGLEKAVGQFVATNIHCTPELFSTTELSSYTANEKYDAYIVGSDQVWRPKYSPCIENYYLNFAENQNVKRIAYAASFGVDVWEYTKSQSVECERLVKKFNAVSVREQTGVSLCKNYYGIEATHVLDPTLLLNTEEYLRLISETELNNDYSELFCYILDKNAETNRLVDNISRKIGISPYFVIKSNQQRTYMTINQWLKGVKSASMVVTDSFHGTVFSLLFNKPFWVVGNKDRGESRIHSLLSMFGLENRLVSDVEDLKISNPIDWIYVNNKLDSMRQASLSFLITSIK